MKLYGKNPVIERLKTNPRTIRKIYLQLSHPDAGYILKKAKKWGIPVFQVPKTKIQKLARNLNTQGVVGEVEGFAYEPYEDLISLSLKKKWTLLFLDNLTDPQNLGAILRSVACMGGFAVVLPSHDSVEVTEAVLRVACGADNFIKVAKVSNLSQAIAQAKEAGFWIAGAVVKGGEDLRETQMPFPLGVVIGSEQKGIRPGIKSHLDKRLTLPMAQPRLSMNAAQAATLFCYEISRQNFKNKSLAKEERHVS